MTGPVRQAAPVPPAGLVLLASPASGVVGTVHAG